MPTPSLIVKFRQQRREGLRRTPGARLGITLGVVSSLFIMLAVYAGILTYAHLTSDLPSLESIPARLEPPNGTWLQPTRLYDRTGMHIILILQHPAAEGWRYLSVSGGSTQPDSFADSLVQATIAALDPAFWQHPGFSWRDLTELDPQSLAQRLVLDLLLSDEPPSLRRTLRLRLLAGQLISRYGHARVLEWYLNSTCYGPLVYGADAASRAYFGKSAADLSLAEAAWLVAVAETPQIDPMAAPSAALQRQQQIITQMHTQGMITAQQADQAAGQRLSFRSVVDQDGPFTAFSRLVLEQIQQALPSLPLERGGLNITTTIDFDLQLQAACAMETQLKRLQGDSAEVLTAIGSSCEAARLLPTLNLDGSLLNQDLAASLVVLDPETGQVLALIGQDSPGLDPAHLPGQPAGTLLTPFIYLSAFVRGFSPATLIWEVPGEASLSSVVLGPTHLEDSTELKWTYHGPVRLRTALANDYLAAAAQMYQRVGADNAWQTAWQFGLNSLGERPSGSGTFEEFLEEEVTLLESVHAFSVFSNLGTQTGQKLSLDSASAAVADLSPVAVLRIEDSTGNMLLDWSRPQERPIVSPQMAYLVNHVLTDEVARWTSLGHPNPLEIGRPAGARLATSLDNTQSITVGYIPQRVVGVWFGSAGSGDQPVPALSSAALWHAVIKSAAQSLLVEDWDAPSGVTRLAVCDPSGLLPTQACPLVVDEVFLAGNEPSQLDNLYQVLRINRESGLLATVFTPTELVEQHVYLVVPEWAEPWAEQAGLLVPPQGYDPIYLAEQGSTSVSLTSPAMFAHVRGQVELRGSAAGPNFDYYRLQVGQGLNPTRWLLVGEDEQQPVTNGRLGVWDTRGLQGLYVVQLSVVRTDSRVDSIVLQVTVDNSPPTVTIMDPSAAEQFQGQVGENILLQAAGMDDLVLERLEFYLDGELFLTLWQPPYAAIWPSTPGEHTFLVRAYDLAGNHSEQELQFSVQP